MNKTICYINPFGWSGGWKLIDSDFRIHSMVGVAQVVEPQVVALVVVGSSPITHPIYNP